MNDKAQEARLVLSRDSQYRNIIGVYGVGDGHAGTVMA
jgi:hypothetical protein